MRLLRRFMYIECKPVRPIGKIVVYARHPETDELTRVRTIYPAAHA